MDRAWPESKVSIHTGTFLGTRSAARWRWLRSVSWRQKLVTRSAEMGEHFSRSCAAQPGNPAKRDATPRPRPHARARVVRRGQAGRAIALAVTKRLLAEGFILLPEGEPANILSITPPLTIGKTHIARYLCAWPSAGGHTHEALGDSKHPARGHSVDPIASPTSCMISINCERSLPWPSSILTTRFSRSTRVGAVDRSAAAGRRPRDRHREGPPAG